MALLASVLACDDSSTDPVASPTPTSVTVSASSLSFSSLRETAQLTATVLDQNGQAMADAAIAWMSSEASVAAVDQSGLVTAIGNGVTNLTATAGAATAVVAVTVEQLPNSIEISTPPDSLAVGDSIQMTAEAFDDLGNLIVNATLQWSSSDTTIATVDQEGWVRAWTAGSTEIKVAIGTTASATATLTAVQVLDSIVLSVPRGGFLAVGYSMQLSAEALDALGNPIPDVTVEWSSNHPTVVTVDQQGWVRAMAAGSARIIAAAGSKARATATVTAVQVPDSIVLSAPRDFLAVGDSMRMSAVALDALGNPIPDVTFEWSSRQNRPTMTVDQQGWVRAWAPGWFEVSVQLRKVSASKSLIGFVEQPLERAALEALYHATNGPEWERNANWLTDMPLREWEGVRTEWRTGKVIWLSLSSNGLSGPVPPELGSLSDLEQLNLSGNNLSGPIAPELGALSRLEHLALSWNPLTAATIPPELGRLTQLKHLGLHHTAIRGPIPPELGNLGSLESLWLGGGEDNLTGRIPPELGNLGSLRRLFIWSHSLTGPVPAELWKLTNLESLRILAEGISGSIPPELGYLRKLETLDFSLTGLTGAIPPELGRLTRLTSLTLNHTRLSGRIPRQLGSLAGLKTLWIHNNDLEGRLPDTFLNLHLDEFRWDNNSVCLPDTQAFRAWRGRIQTAVGPYCAAGAAAFAENAHPTVTILPSTSR